MDDDWKRMYEVKQKDWLDMCDEVDALEAEIASLRDDFDITVKALHKIYDPMKFHHWEEDPYTRAGCFQFVAQEALKAIHALPEEEEK